MAVKLMKRILIVAIFILIASFISMIGGAFELSLLLTKAAGAIGFAVFVVYLVTCLIKEW